MKKVVTPLLLMLIVSSLVLSSTLSAHASRLGLAVSKHTFARPGLNLKKEEAKWFRLSHFGQYRTTPDARIRAREQAKHLPKGHRPLASSSWTPLGPQPLNSALISQAVGIVSGRITTIAVNPTNAKDIWIGTAEGGVWNSSDGGTTWTAMTDSQSILAVGSIAVDPKDSNIIYVGTGEANLNVDAYWGLGVLKSTDHGSTWTNLGLSDFGGLGIGKIAVDPANSQVLLLSATQGNTDNSSPDGGPTDPSSNYGIWRSADGGTTWTQVLGDASAHAYGTDVTFDPADSTIAFAGMGGGSGTIAGVYKSTDSGATWTQISALPTSGTNIVRVSLGISADGSHVYSVLTNPAGDLAGSAIYVSTDTGATWAAQDVSTVPGMVDDDQGHQWWYDTYAAVDPTDSAGNTVYVGGVDIWQTKDGGTTWTNLTNAYKGGPIHPDQHTLAFTSSTSSSYYIGNDGGIWAGDANGSFTNLNGGGLNITQLYGGSIGETGSHAQIYAGAQDNGEDQYPVNGSGAAEWNEVYGGDGGDTAVDYTDNAVVYEEYVRGAIHKSVDGGASWKAATNGINLGASGDPVNFIMPFVLSPNNHSELFAGTDRIYRTTNGAASWEAISGSLDSGTKISIIAVAPGNDSTIYAGDNGGKIYTTTDGGGTWHGGAISGSTGGMVRGIAVDPSNSQIVYASFADFASGTGHHVFKSTDGGASWTDISKTLPNIPCSSLLVLGTNIIVGTDVGVLFSSDNGATWSNVGTGLPNVAIDQVFLNAGGTILFVATHGRGMWTFALQ